MESVDPVYYLWHNSTSFSSIQGLLVFIHQLLEGFLGLNRMESLRSNLAGNILNKSGEKVDFDDVFKAGQYVGLYFSAHWCPPCKTFTPKLAEYYEKLKEDGTKKFEIIFVSSDRDKSQFEEYYKEMPWLCLDFEKRDEKGVLGKSYKVSGIPSLVIVEGETGKTVTTKGRAKVTGEPDAFPWPAESFADVLYSGDFIRNDGTTVKADEVKNKVKAVYFSAHWCPPCRGFTPQLVKTYNKIREDGKEFEVIFASSDKDDSAFKEYFGTMPWLALPFGDARKEKLSELCDVEGIPTLVVYNAEDKKITSDGRAAVGADSDGKEFPWKPKPLNLLNEDTASQINDNPCMVILTDGKAESVTKAKEQLKATADLHFSEDPDQQKLFFFYTEEDDDLVDSLKNFTKISGDTPQLVILDIPSQKVYEHKGEITPEAVATMAENYLGGALEARALR